MSDLNGFLKKLSPENKKLIFSVVTEISQVLELQVGPTLKIEYWATRRDPIFGRQLSKDMYFKTRRTGLEALRNQGVIKTFTWENHRLDEVIFYVDLISSQFLILTRLINGLNPASVTPDSNNLQVPAGTKWEEIELRFFDGHNVEIKYPGGAFRSDYKEMGFEDSKSRKPNQQWEMLERLSQNNGEISWEGKSQLDKFSGGDVKQDLQGFSIIKVPDGDKKQKQLLSKALKECFDIKEDPFYPYKKVKCYKIKIRLIPS